ncbi:hypothetical protein PAHAL_1G159600 [Panicum hallii]|uniref:Uncharacterized protein n=1 Tax=Panicum hallii TaxID=206008 RepID=A0A2T8KVF5_9POAL|nr:hypothetical protein PAHAL_1G159600 [Panicum hallii]
MRRTVVRIGLPSKGPHGRANPEPPQGSVFRISKQLGILHILLTALCSAVVLTPSCRMNSEGFTCIVHYSFPYEICSTWTKGLRRLRTTCKEEQAVRRDWLRIRC